MSQSQAATSSQQSLADFSSSSFITERVIARTNFAERVRRSVNETRRNRGETTTTGAINTSVYSMYSSQTPSTSTAAGTTTRGRKTSKRKSSTTVKRRRGRGRRTTKRKKPQRRRKRRVTTTKTTTRRKTTTKTKSTTKTTSSLNKTLKNRVTSRKTTKKVVKRRRKSKYRKRRPALRTAALSSAVGRRTIKLNAISIKRKVLDRAKQRLLTKYIKRDEERRGMDWSQPSVNASLNNVTTDLMSDYIPLNVPAPHEIASTSHNAAAQRLSFESKPMTR